MNLYDGIENKLRKVDILKYEKIIEEIKTYYDAYRVIDLKEINYESRALYCLENGTYGFNRYLHDYLISKTVDPSIKKYIEGIDSRKEIAISNNLQNASFQFSNLIKKYFKFSNVDLNKMSIVDQIDFIKNSFELETLTVSKDKEDIDFIFFELGSKVLKEYSDLHDEIYSIIKNNNVIDEDKVKFIKKYIKDNNITIDRSLILDEIKKIAIDRQEKINYVSNLIVEYEPISGFNEIATKLRNKIEYHTSMGKDINDILEEVLPEAYGLVMAACEKAFGYVPYDVQLMGAIALNEGKISEMYTGEGKTLTAIFPAFLNALTGKEVDIFTPNDYLSSRDSEINRKVFSLLGMTVGCVKSANQSREEKKEQYKCDIVYGSSTAFAFDFLSDIDMLSEDCVCRRENPGFAIVDEADQILINNALNPYQIVKSKSSSSLKKKKEEEKVIKSLEKAFDISNELMKTCARFTTVEKYDAFINDEDSFDKIDEKYSIVIGPKAVHITTKGEREIFYNYMIEDIISLSDSSKDYFLDSVNYNEGVDYVLRSNKLVLTPIGVEKASFELKEFQDLKMKWLTNTECIDMMHYINNALTAQFVMVKGEDYQVVVNPETGIKEVVILQSGRILENSKYQHGLHQAIEIKEEVPLLKSKNDSIVDDISSSISNRALLCRYDKFCGMTGTADKSAFSDIYKLDTFEVPRNKVYQYSKGLITEKPFDRVDHPTRLYKTEEEKISAIVEDIVLSNSKGQPLLVVTNNDEKARKLHEMLQSKYGLSSSLLVAGKSLNDEAQIIANAGRYGCITIASEMAGRGTDIKIGGDFNIDENVLTGSVLFEIHQENEARARYELSDKSKDYVTFKRDVVIDLIKKYRNNSALFEAVMKKYKYKYDNDQDFHEKVDLRVDEKKSRHFDQIEKIKELGGIKYIQMNPFTTSRNDNQGKGRVGRQGEPGETIMYASIDDLKEIRANEDNIERLGTLLNNPDYLTDEETQSIIDETIETAQLNNEFEYDLQIASTDTMDYSVNSLGMLLLKSKRKIMETDNPSVQFDKVIDHVIEEIIKNNVPNRKKKKVDNDSGLLFGLKLDYSSMLTEIHDVFGLELDEKDIKDNCDFVGNLKDYVFDKVKEKQSIINNGKSEETINDTIKSSLVTSMNNMYSSFLYSSEIVRLQQLNDGLANNNSHDRTRDLESLYSSCMTSGFRECVSSVFKPFVRKKENVDNSELLNIDSEYIEGLPSIEEVLKTK